MNTIKKYFLLSLSAGLLLLAVVVLFFGRTFPVVWAKSYLVQISFVVLVFSLAMIILKKWKEFFVSFASFLVIFSLFFPYLRNIHLPVSNEKNTIKVFQFNILKGNTHKEETIQLIKNENADVVMLEEVNAEWGKLLEESMKTQYPYYKIITREDFYGMALFSKVPLSGVEIVDVISHTGITALINTESSRIRIFGVHTKAPTTASNLELRNEQIRFLGETIGKYDDPVLVMGDFNAVPWDDVMVEFVEKTGLTDSRSTLSPTFPSWGGFMKVPIDYIFHSSGIMVYEIGVVENEWSDHYGIKAEISSEKLK